MKEGDFYLISYTKLNINALSLIAAILIFFPLNYAVQSIGSWYEHTNAEEAVTEMPVR